MSIRAKMHLEAVVSNQYGGVKAFWRTNYDNSIAEDQQFCKATPNGLMEQQIDNPAAIDQLVIGKSYYITVEPCD